MVKSLGIGAALLLLLFTAAIHAQAPGSFDRTIDQLRFETPTRIEGRMLLPDTYDDAIWLRLTRVFEEGRWAEVIHSVQLLVYARDADMMKFLRKLPPETVLRMTIQADEAGKRRILELEGA